MRTSVVSHARGPSGKTVVVGMKGREANKIVAKPVSERTKEELHGLIGKNVSSRSRSILTTTEAISGFPTTMRASITA